MTESTAVATRGFNTEKIHNYSSVGLLAPNMQAKVVDWITGSLMPPGCMGELYLRGPAIMRGKILFLEVLCNLSSCFLYWTSNSSFRVCSIRS